MSVNEFIKQLEGYNLWIAIGLCAIPFLIWLYGKVVKREKRNDSPHKYVYSFFTYLVSAPGILSIVLLLYSLFIANLNLLNVNLVIFVLPAIIMLTSIFLIKRDVDIIKLPGFNRLLGLYITLGATFILTLIIVKLRLFVFFSSSVGALIGLALVLFLAIKFGGRLIFRKKEKDD